MSNDTKGIAVVYSDTHTGFLDERIARCFRNCKPKELKTLRKNEEVWVETVPGRFPNCVGYIRVTIVHIEHFNWYNVIYWEDTDCCGKEKVYFNEPSRTPIVKIRDPHKLFEILKQEPRALRRIPRYPG